MSSSFAKYCVLSLPLLIFGETAVLKHAICHIAYIWEGRKYSIFRSEDEEGVSGIALYVSSTIRVSPVRLCVCDYSANPAVPATRQTGLDKSSPRRRPIYSES